MLFFDPLYLLFAAPGLILAGWASWKTHSTFNKYSRVRSRNGICGAEAAARLLQSAGIHDVNITQVDGFLSDHYDPARKTLRLSPRVYRSDSLSAIGVACHEAGHAIQDARHYAPLSFRSALVPATYFSNSVSYIFLIIGFIFMAPKLILVGAIVFSVAVLFSLVTLPVEWNASARAKELMVSAGIVQPEESRQAGQVLNAAFMTYVASAVNALLMLLYFLLRAGVLGGGDD